MQNYGNDAWCHHSVLESHILLMHAKRRPAVKTGIPGGPCAHCGAVDSPQWRRPLTKKVVLCNACGIYYSRHHSLPKRKKVRAGGSTPWTFPTRDELLMHVAQPSTSFLATMQALFKQMGGDDGFDSGADAMDAGLEVSMACDAPQYSQPCHAGMQQHHAEHASQMRPISISRDSICSAEYVTQRQEAGPFSGQPAPQWPQLQQHPYSAAQLQHPPQQQLQLPTPANSVHTPTCGGVASPATSCGSPVQYSSGVAAPPSTPKYPDSLFEPHAEDSLAKRVREGSARLGLVQTVCVGLLFSGTR